MNYYISDLHLGHENIIRFDERPFNDIQEMNCCIIENWNRTVTKNDTVYIIGDFIWDKESDWRHWLEKLNGRKVLIRGNHDPKNFSASTKRYLQEVTDYKEITDSGHHVIMCHYPIPFHRGDYDEKCVMLYGHVHKTREYVFLERLRRDVVASHADRSHAQGKFVNVGCMMPWMDYTPRTLDEILKNEKSLYEENFFESEE